MGRKIYSAEQIIGKLREAEVLLSQGQTVGEVSLRLGVTQQTYYRWRKEYGGMRIAQAKRLKQVEVEEKTFIFMFANCLAKSLTTFLEQRIVLMDSL